MFRIGRIQLTNIGAWRPDLSGQVRVSGKIAVDDATMPQDIATHWATQILELLDTGRRASQILPVTWDDNPAVNGYYAVTGGTVTPIDDAIPLGWTYELDLQKLPGGNALPKIESILLGGYRPNQVSVANTAHAISTLGASNLQPEWYTPAGAFELAPNGNFSTQRTSNGYDVNRYQGFKGGYQTVVASWAVSAANFYNGGCLIEQKVGSIWLPVVGTQTVITDTTKLRISNGYMGFTFDHPSNANEMGIRFHGLGRTNGVLNWSTLSTFLRLSPNQVVDPTTVTAITVLRNDPEEVRLRVSGSFAVGNNQDLAIGVYFDLSLRRGGDHVTVVFPAGYVEPSVKFDATANTASTTTTEGIFKTGANQTWCLTTGGATSVTKDTTGGSIRVNNAGGFVAFGIGPIYDSTAGNLGYTGSKTRWYAPLTERQRIVGR